MTWHSPPVSTTMNLELNSLVVLVLLIRICLYVCQVDHVFANQPALLCVKESMYMDATVFDNVYKMLKYQATF